MARISVDEVLAANLQYVRGATLGGHGLSAGSADRRLETRNSNGRLKEQSRR